MNVPDNSKKTWFARLQQKVRAIRETYGGEVTVTRVLGFMVVRLLAEGLRYALQELWKELSRPW